MGRAARRRRHQEDRHQEDRHEAHTVRPAAAAAAEFTPVQAAYEYPKGGLLLLLWRREESHHMVLFFDFMFSLFFDGFHCSHCY